MNTNMNLHKYIRTQKGDKYWNVTHIAGFGIEEISDGLYGVMVYTNLVPKREGSLLYSDYKKENTEKVFDILWKFLREGGQPSLDLTTLRL